MINIAAQVKLVIPQPMFVVQLAKKIKIAINPLVNELAEVEPVSQAATVIQIVRQPKNVLIINASMLLVRQIKIAKIPKLAIQADVKQKATTLVNIKNVPVRKAKIAKLDSNASPIKVGKPTIVGNHAPKDVIKRPKHV